jgi:hypothetical protein
VLFKTRMISYKRLIKILQCNLMLFWTSTSKPSSIPETTNVSISNGCERCYNIDINALCAKSQHSNVEQVLIESCDEAIGKENDNLKLEVKRLEQNVNVLEKASQSTTISR